MEGIDKNLARRDAGATAAAKKAAGVADPAQNSVGPARTAMRQAGA